ncbi:MAG TPA: FAD-dependent oxidoreductase [Chloroflexota bacterium]|nr:FAD-dependent oxidoreductase [Chloroflexota bacterium]
MRVGILGAGVAGLSAAWLLARRGVDVTVLEREPYVGGLARSFRWHDFWCDFAAHRLFSENEAVLQQLLALVPMGRHIRRSRIRLNGTWVADPVNVGELLVRFFPATSARIALTYLTRPRRGRVDSFESYVLRRYGAGLNDLFFSPYTEKLFGIPASEVALDWAVRKVRIAGPLSAWRSSSKKHFSYFYYPVRGGYGAIANRLADELGGRVRLRCGVRELRHDGSRLDGVVVEQDGERRTERFDEVISTLPLPVLGRMLGHQFPLSFRKVDAVYLLVDRPYVSDNHWVYFIDRAAAINRMVEFKNMSPVDRPPDQTVLCAEVTGEFDDLAERVVGDVVGAGLAGRDAIRDTLVKREPFSYPVYDRRYHTTVEAAREVLGRFGNLHLLGRAAEFEHKELDDNFASAVALVNRLCERERIVVATDKQERTVAEASTVPSVHAIVLAFNNQADTLECLESVRALSYPNLKVVLVDNGSTDGTPSAVRERFPDVHVIETGQNLGVPRGFNVGFTWALQEGADYVLMLNNDTTVAPEMLAELVRVAEAEHKAGIVMPKVLYYDQPDLVWSAGGRYRLFPPAIVMVGRSKPEGGPFDRLGSIEYAPSCGLLIHRRAFELAGLFDPGYFFLYDDWDFSERVRAHGLGILFVPTARMWHKVSRTTRSRSDLFWRVWGESCARFYRRHGRPVFVSLPVHMGYILARELVHGNAGSLGHFLSGAWVGLTKPLGPVPTLAESELFRAG